MARLLTLLVVKHPRLASLPLGSEAMCSCVEVEGQPVLILRPTDGRVLAFAEGPLDAGAVAEAAGVDPGALVAAEDAVEVAGADNPG